MMLLLGFLLVMLIKPYYRNDRLKTIDVLSETMEKLLLNDDVKEKDIESAARTIIGNNVCAIIYNESGNNVYYPPDSLGQLCMLDKPITVGEEVFTIRNDPEKMIDLIRQESPFSLTIQSPYADLEMLLYGKRIRTNLANYYLILNTPLEPAESYIDFILNQYLYIAVIVIFIALILALFLARRISQPIVKMKDEANKLAQGDYDVSFKTNSFSEINDLASTLDDATDKLSKVNDLRKDLVANVSHDIKTPLTMIRAYAEMIKDISGDDPEKRNEHLDVILQETEYLNKLVTDMSELSKLQSGIIEVRKDNFDLKECTNNVVLLLSKVITEKNIQLILDLDDCLVYADEIKISQVIYNFLSNALKYSNDGGRIEVSLKTRGKQREIRVFNTGTPIPPEDREKIFDRFWRADPAHGRDTGGHGLGLAIAKSIVESHHGKIAVSSEDGRGSAFTVTLNA